MNMQAIMAQAQRMQKDIQKKQAEIYANEFEGKSGAVRLVLSGDKQMKVVEIDKSIIGDEEDLAALEDMIKIAYNEAVGKIEKEIDSKLGAYAKGLNGLM